jgi:hypothetical protein
MCVGPRVKCVIFFFIVLTKIAMLREKRKLNFTKNHSDILNSDALTDTIGITVAFPAT